VLVCPVLTDLYMSLRRAVSSSFTEFKIGVAIMVNAGAAMVYSVRTIDAYEAKTE